jgi:hypothetical protein
MRSTVTVNLFADDDAVASYQKFGFASLTGRPRTLYLPVATALSLIG